MTGPPVQQTIYYYPLCKVDFLKNKIVHDN